MESYLRLVWWRRWKQSRRYRRHRADWVRPYRSRMASAVMMRVRRHRSYWPHTTAYRSLLRHALVMKGRASEIGLVPRMRPKMWVWWRNMWKRTASARRRAWIHSRWSVLPRASLPRWRRKARSKPWWRLERHKQWRRWRAAMMMPSRKRWMNGIWSLHTRSLRRQMLLYPVRWKKPINQNNRQILNTGTTVCITTVSAHPVSGEGESAGNHQEAS